MARWGLLLKLHGTSFKEIKLQSSCMFFTVTFAWFVRAVVRKTDFRRGKKLKRFNRKHDTTIFHLYSKAANTSDGWFVNLKKLKLEEMCLRQTLAADCRLAKTFHMRRQNRVVAQMPRYTGVLTTDFK
jgi:hypothetical protein